MNQQEFDHLSQYATDRQRELLKALLDHGSERKAAEALGVAKSNFYAVKKAVQAKAAMSGDAPEYDYTHPVPPGYVVKGMSTLYDEAGNIKLQWNKTQIDKEAQWQMFQEAVEELCRTIPAVEPIPLLDQSAMDALAVYPVGDHHMGMLAWDKETGADYDLRIGERLLDGASSYLIRKFSGAKQCLIVLLGDFFHYDSATPETPTSKHKLDADSRFPKMVRAGLRAACRMIETAAAHHENVHVIVEIGNHDIYSSVFLQEALSFRYENNPRVHIDTSPMHYHYFRFGTTLIGTHHGHGTPMRNLPLLMAADRPQDWGETEYRYWYTGHIHTSKKQAAMSAEDFSGCTVESFRILPGMDAWAHQKGYRSISDMKAILIDPEFGEQSRLTVNPKMLERGIT